jgi:HAD superfamily hydrolase (TIGR01509 family)
MRYRAIGFDYGGVIKGLPGSVFTENICNFLEVEVDEYREAYFRHNKKVNRGEIDWPELWRLVLNDLGKIEKLDGVLAIDDRSSSNTKDQINDNVLQLVDDIRNRGYKVGLLSNNTLEAGRAIRELGLQNHFDVFHISAETRLVKPEPEAFSLFAEELGVELEELIFIDDAPKSLSTAKECGYTPLLFTSYKKLQEDLKSYGIL